MCFHGKAFLWKFDSFVDMLLNTITQYGIVYYSYCYSLSPLKTIWFFISFSFSLLPTRLLCARLFSYAQKTTMNIAIFDALKSGKSLSLILHVVILLQFHKY